MFALKTAAVIKFQTETRWRFEMIAYVLVYAFLAVSLGAMLYVVGTPWITPKSRIDSRRKARKNIGNVHN
jgi:hypothetical protein